MTLFSYEIFDAVARQGSFNKAAQQLHLTPSAISHAIAVMEEELGFALFNRGKNGVSMTSYGASLYPSIRDVLNSDEALKQSIARLNGLEKGILYIDICSFLYFVKGQGKAGCIQLGVRLAAARAAEKLCGALSADRDRSISGHLR